MLCPAIVVRWLFKIMVYRDKSGRTRDDGFV